MHHIFSHAAAWMAGTLHASFQALQRHYRERRMISALQALSDAELKDIGVYRCAIPAVARARWADPGEA